MQIFQSENIFQSPDILITLLFITKKKTELKILVSFIEIESKKKKFKFSPDVLFFAFFFITTIALHQVICKRGHFENIPFED